MEERAKMNTAQRTTGSQSFRALGMRANMTGGHDRLAGT
jgi:hypothetical protein